MGNRSRAEFTNTSRFGAGETASTRINLSTQEPEQLRNMTPPAPGGILGPAVVLGEERKATAAGAI